MMRFLKKLHKWIGLLIGLQVLLWVLSGLVISLLDPAKVNGRQWADMKVHETESLPKGVLLEPAELPAAQTNGALSISLSVIRGEPVYTIQHPGSETLLSALDGSIILTGRADAEELAKEDFTGEGEIIELDGALTIESIMGEEVVVTAMMRGQTAAISQQVNSNTIVNVVSKEKIMELNLAGKTAFVTGGNIGIGRAVSIALAR